MKNANAVMRPFTYHLPGKVQVRGAHREVFYFFMDTKQGGDIYVASSCTTIIVRSANWRTLHRSINLISIPGGERVKRETASFAERVSGHLYYGLHYYYQLCCSVDLAPGALMCET